MNSLAGREFRRILIVKPSSPGDILHALPVLHALRARFPRAHIAWLVATPFADLIAADPALNEVILFDRRRYGRVGRNLAVTADFFRFVLELRRRAFDMVVDLQGLFRSGFFAAASGAPARLGFRDAREFAWLFYSHALPGWRGEEHALDKNARLIGDALRLDRLDRGVRISLTADDRRVAGELLASVGLAAGDPVVVLVPATRWETKCWPAECFGQLAAGLRDRAGARSILVGGRDDGPAAERAIAASAGSAASICGRTTLRQLAAVIERAALVVTGDSTPMHLAAALDRPMVALFGPTSPVRTGPYGRLGDVLRLPLDCSPCYLRDLRDCRHDHACMRRLDVSDVLDAALSRFSRQPGSSS